MTDRLIFLLNDGQVVLESSGETLASSLVIHPLMLHKTHLCDNPELPIHELFMDTVQNRMQWKCQSNLCYICQSKD